MTVSPDKEFGRAPLYCAYDWLLLHIVDLIGSLQTINLDIVRMVGLEKI